MKITESQIRQVIKEEIKKVINEMYDDQDKTIPSMPLTAGQEVTELEQGSEVTEQEAEKGSMLLKAALFGAPAAWTAFINYCSSHPDFAHKAQELLNAAMTGASTAMHLPLHEKKRK
jgi:hypothetical protein